MSGVPETTHKQNTNPERDGAREILVEHPAPSSDRHGMGQRYPRYLFVSSRRGVLNRVGGGRCGGCPQELSHINCGTTRERYEPDEYQ